MNAADCAARTVEVMYADLRATDAAVEAAVVSLSGKEVQRASRLHHGEDRRRYVVSHAILREALSRRMGADARGIEYVEGPGGKPELRDRAPWHFSMSRADDAAAFALAHGPVGIDLVAMCDAERLVEAAAEFCTPREQAAVQRLPRETRPEALARIWARKEALLKATGEGIRRSMASLEVPAGSGADAAGVTLRAGRAWRVRDLAAPPGYRAAIAVCDGGETVSGRVPGVTG